MTSNTWDGQDGPLIFLMGPTGVGKTAVALMLADCFPVESVNADSVQVYRGLTIGSAKPTPEELARAPHHLLDLVEPEEPFSVGRYREEAEQVITACWQRDHVPLLVGGTGLYFRAVESGLAPVPPVDPLVRQRIRAEAERLGWPALHARLTLLDPEWAGRVAPRDGQRIGRGLDVAESTGRPLSAWIREQEREGGGRRVLKLALTLPREELYPRIEARFDAMLRAGLLEEAQALWQRGLDPELPAMKAVGYRELFAHFRGEITLEQAVALAKCHSRQYAKRQMTWLRREPGVVWVTPGEGERIKGLVGEFLDRREGE